MNSFGAVMLLVLVALYNVSALPQHKGPSVGQLVRNHGKRPSAATEMSTEIRKKQIQFPVGVSRMKSMLASPIRCTEKNIPDCRVHVYWQGCSPTMFTYRPEDFTPQTEAWLDSNKPHFVLFYWFSCNENIELFCL